ncbi:hypothetical protein sscle_06g052100 [Sclerotinia sclerotiorum 1980 UF-70]|uniref:Uncharacterized protein n=1 Tax=Sclerotinia sclerotiorum (strain ATCC 18683 / 1980 / Ss-1) TaxID=665079 RepID=A0A1D9Q650_SCLS1|nr:hypothetical protein sscle_06g052100 [Sclerotinia sclerotiorum 1980 UF-70]
MPPKKNMWEPNYQQHNPGRHHVFNRHGHDVGTPCIWETMESYQRQWSFPAFSRASASVPSDFPPHGDGEQCIYEIIAWENCSWVPPLENPNDGHIGFCVTGLKRPCKYWKPEQLGPRTCCDFGMTFLLKEPLRKGYCLGENCPEGVGRKNFPFIDYLTWFYYGHCAVDFQDENERLHLLEAERAVGKDVRFQWKNADGPCYESFEIERIHYNFGWNGRGIVPKPVKSHMPSDSPSPWLS